MRFSGLFLSVLLLISGVAPAADLKPARSLGSLKSSKPAASWTKLQSPAPVRAPAHSANAVIGQKLGSPSVVAASSGPEQIEWRALVVKLPGGQVNLPQSPGSDRGRMALYGFLEMRLP